MKLSKGKHLETGVNIKGSGQGDTATIPKTNYTTGSCPYKLMLIHKVVMRSEIIWVNYLKNNKIQI